MKEYRDEFPLSVMCWVLRVSRSGYYAWLGREESRRAEANLDLLEKIRGVHTQSRGTYGSPRVWHALRQAGEGCGKNRVARLMRAYGIAGARKPRYKVTTDSGHMLPVAPNLLERRFAVAAPNVVWLSDLTCVWTGEGWLYVVPVLDLFARRIVGCSMGASPDRWLVMRALEMAIGRRRPGPGLIFHSDRGSQYAAGDVQKLLAEHEMVASMSRKGDCWDNAPAESFFATLKTELVYRRRYRTREEAKRELFEYIERFYNRKRMHSALGYLSPAEFEARANANLNHQCVHQTGGGSDVGVADSSGGPGTVSFQVLVDGVVRAESPVMHPREMHRFSVDVSGAKLVTLRVTNGGDGHSCDHSVWGYARFIAIGKPDPLAASSAE